MVVYVQVDEVVAQEIKISVANGCRDHVQSSQRTQLAQTGEVFYIATVFEIKVLEVGQTF